MYLEIDDADLRSVLPLYDQQRAVFIRGSQGMRHVRVQPAGIGAVGAVLHLVPADKGNILHLASGIEELSGSQILHSQNRRVRELFYQPIHIFRIVFIHAGICRAGTQMGMGAGNKYCPGICIHRPGSGRPDPVHQLLVEADDIHTHNDDPCLPVIKGNGGCQQRIQDPVGIPGLIIARQSGSQGRGNVDSTETGFEHNYFLLYRKTHLYQKLVSSCTSIRVQLSISSTGIYSKRPW